MQTKQQRPSLAILKERYTFATRIPKECYDFTADNGRYEVSGSIRDLPDSYCTVDQICVSNGKWLEVFDEERLSRAEQQEQELRKWQSFSKPCIPCHSN